MLAMLIMMAAVVAILFTYRKNRKNTVKDDKNKNLHKQRAMPRFEEPTAAQRLEHIFEPQDYRHAFEANEQRMSRLAIILIGIVLLIALIAFAYTYLTRIDWPGRSSYEEGKVVLTVSEYEELKAQAEANNAAVDSSAAPAQAETTIPEEEPAPARAGRSAPQDQETPDSAEIQKADMSDLSTEEINAVSKAQTYLEIGGFSKQGLIDQLSSEYGEKYPVETATRAVEFIEENGMVDWNEQAYMSAKLYLSFEEFSEEDLVEQLSGEYSEGFTKEQAEYGAEKALGEQ